MRTIAWGSVFAATVVFCVGCSRPTHFSPPAEPTHQLATGSVCAQGGDCDSSICLGQRCCTASCGTDPTCGATTCDDTGACVYPTGACGQPNCSSDQLTTSTCQQGTCVAGSAAFCSDGFACADETSCRTSCGGSTDCRSGFYCAAGACLSQLSPGSPCQQDDACASGICGLMGGGRCCSAACATGDLNGCDTTGCDATGACIYPSTSSACLAPACTGHKLTQGANCDGMGSCAVPTPATIDCPNYVCATPTSCGTSCGATSDCWAGGGVFCQLAAGVCCAPRSTSTVSVDGTQGIDQACCGTGPNADACATIAYAEALAHDTGVVPITLFVANPPDGKDWTADLFPIVLDQGISLAAPGVYFSDPTPDPADGGSPWTLFWVANRDGISGAVPSVIQGSALEPIHLGSDPSGASGLELHSIQVGGGLPAGAPTSTLALVNAEIQVSTDYPDVLLDRAGILVDESASVTLGTNGLGTSGTVWIHNPDGGVGDFGIQCGVDGGVQPSTLNDTGSTASPSVTIQGLFYGVLAYPTCSVRLTSGPVFGIPPEDGVCSSPDGMVVNGAVIASGGEIDNAIFQCNRNGGLWVGPGFTGDSDLFLHNGAGAAVLNWSDIDGGPPVRITRSIFKDNWVGAQVGITIGTDLQLDLSGGGNEISRSCDPTSIDLLAGGSVNAENVAWDAWDADAGHNEMWICDVMHGPYVCTCGGSCPTFPAGQAFETIQVGAPIVSLFSSGAPAPPMTIDDADGTLGTARTVPICP